MELELGSKARRLRLVVTPSELELGVAVNSSIARWLDSYGWMDRRGLHHSIDDLKLNERLESSL